ncbi:MAG: Calx-beta domain-containing protein [Acidobacteriota bacterium]
MKSLFPVFALAIFVCLPVAAAPPTVLLQGNAAIVTLPAGHTVAYSTFKGQYTIGAATDEDLDGQVTISPVSLTSDSVFVDIDSGEWVFSLYGTASTREASLPLTSIVRGPNGAFSEIVLPTSAPVSALWVRPGIGVWGVPQMTDEDGTVNGLLFYNTTGMVPLGTSPAKPPGFAKGDLLLTLNHYETNYRGLVDPVLDHPQGPSVVSFAAGSGFSVTEGQSKDVVLIRSGSSDETVTVRCTPSSSAVPDVDYVPFDPALTFGPGEVIKRLRITTLNDSVYTAGGRSLRLTLTDPVGGAIGNYPTHLFEIADDDPRPTMTVEGLPGSVDERDAPWSFPVTIGVNGVFRGTVVISYQAGSVSGDLVFQSGDPKKTFDIPVEGNDMTEADRWIAVHIASGVTSSSSINTTVRIIDDDLPQLTVDDVVVVEDSYEVRIKARIAPAAAKDVLVTYTTVDGTAKAGEDYVAKTDEAGGIGSELSWGIVLRHDAVAEDPETFYVDLTAITAATTLQTRVAVTIIDDDGPAPAVTITPVSVMEGNSGSVPVEMHVRFAAPSQGSVVLTLETVAGTARAGDYQYISSQVTFAPGEVEKTFPIKVYGDTTDEEDETFELVARQGTDVRGRGTITILDDDTSSFIRVEDTTVEEKTGTSAFAVFRVTLAPTPVAEVRVDYSTADVTALAGADYKTTNGTIVFAAGQASAEVRVEVLGDNAVEPAETFTLRLLNVVGAYLQQDRATATIFDDDSPAPPVAIAGASVLEGNAGSVQVPLKLILSHSLSHAVTFTVATNGTGTASLADYQALNQVVTFAAGQTELTLQATVLGDTAQEPNETFGVEVREGGELRATATVTILDDDTPSLISVGDLEVREKTGSSAQAVFIVTISPPPVALASVQFTTADGTAQANADYVPFAGTILFFPGQNQTEIPVAVVGDALDESDETFTLRLSGAVGATLQDDRGTATIVDDDASTPDSVFNVADLTMTETTGSSAFAVFRVTLSPASSSSASIAYTTQDGTATSGADYLPVSGTLVFNPGQTERQVQVQVYGDALTEAAETLRLKLSSPSGAILGTATATATIVDDDQVVVNPTVSVADIEVREGDGVSEARFIVSLSKALTTTARVTYSTVEHTAMPDTDYVETSGSLTFAPGETAKTVTVVVRGDHLAEAQELFRLELRSSEGVPIADGSAICTIVDDDAVSKRRASRH